MLFMCQRLILINGSVLCVWQVSTSITQREHNLFFISWFVEGNGWKWHWLCHIWFPTWHMTFDGYLSQEWSIRYTTNMHTHARSRLISPAGSSNTVIPFNLLSNIFLKLFFKFKSSWMLAWPPLETVLRLIIDSTEGACERKRPHGKCPI